MTSQGQLFTWMGSDAGWIAENQASNSQLESMYWNYSDAGENPFQGAYGNQIREWASSTAGMRSGINANSNQLDMAAGVAYGTALFISGGVGAGEAGGNFAIRGLERRADFLEELAKDETTVFRVFGGDAQAAGYSWTPENPLGVENFRNAAGLPSGGESGATNTAEHLIEGIVKRVDIIKTRMALPLDGNAAD